MNIYFLITYIHIRKYRYVYTIYSKWWHIKEKVIHDLLSTKKISKL